MIANHMSFILSMLTGGPLKAHANVSAVMLAEDVGYVKNTAAIEKRVA